MTQFERAFGGLAILAMAAALIAAAFAGWRSYRHDQDPHRAIARMLLAGSLVCALGVALQPAPGPAGVELIPFRNLGSPSGSDQVVANVLLLVPTGLALGCLRPVRQAVLLGVAICGSIELAQALLPLGRVAATEDFLLNTVGFTIGVTSARAASAVWLNARKARRNSA